MHCDDKQTLFALKKGIEEAWNELKKADFNDEDLIKKFAPKITEGTKRIKDWVEKA